MGKGGAANYGAPAELPSKRHPAPSYERSELATTLAQPSDEITKRSLRECIPAHCFVRSYAHSLGHLAWDLAMVATAFFAVHYASGVLPFYLVPVAWLGYWWYQGLTCTGLWVLGTRAPSSAEDCSMSVAAALLTSLALGAVELNAENWDSQLAGRAAFVKFLAPW